MGNTCKPMAVSFQCMTKSTTIKKKKRKKTVPPVTRLCPYLDVINAKHKNGKKSSSGWRSLHFPVTTSHLRGGNTAEISEAKIYRIFHCLMAFFFFFLAVHSPKTYVCN